MLTARWLLLVVDLLFAILTLVLLVAAGRFGDTGVTVILIGDVVLLLLSAFGLAPISWAR